MVALEDGASLVPRAEVGLRHDGGDAETGIGVELGAGLAWTDPARGLSLDLGGRALVRHDDSALRDWGVSGALAFDPDPASARGPSLTLRQDRGARAAGGVDALFAAGAPAQGGASAAGARDYSVGWRLAPEAAGAPDIAFGLTATRRESAAAAAEHRIGGEVVVRW